MQLWLRWTLGLLILCAALPPNAAEESLRFGRFGAVTLYRHTPHPAHVVLLVSGEAGWNPGMVEIAKELSTSDSLVVGIDSSRYVQSLQHAAEVCSYPAGDFDAVSQFVQKQLGFPQYVPPILVGYATGATLVYAALAQAPPTTFQGAVSLGLCLDLPGTTSFCRGHGLEWQPKPEGQGYRLLPTTTLDAPWMVLQGTDEPGCDPAMIERYVDRVPRGIFVALPPVGQEGAVPQGWLPQLQEALRRWISSPAAATAPPQAPLRDLPLVEMVPPAVNGNTFAVIISGDGGWASIDRELGKALVTQGVPVVGLNSLQYFWTRRTPDGAAKDLERILRYYLAAWHRDQVLLIGYSRGADVLPFMAHRLPDDLRARVRIVAIMGPTRWQILHSISLTG